MIITNPLLLCDNQQGCDHWYILQDDSEPYVSAGTHTKIPGFFMEVVHQVSSIRVRTVKVYACSEDCLEPAILTAFLAKYQELREDPEL